MFRPPRETSHANQGKVRRPNVKINKKVKKNFLMKITLQQQTINFLAVLHEQIISLQPDDVALILQNS